LKAWILYSEQPWPPGPGAGLGEEDCSEVRDEEDEDGFRGKAGGGDYGSFRRGSNFSGGEENVIQLQSLYIYNITHIHLQYTCTYIIHVEKPPHNHNQDHQNNKF